MFRIKALCLLGLAICLGNPSYANEPKPTLTVFAAASLTEPLEAIGAAYTKLTDIKVRFSFAASSTLARQIEAGALPQIFISANTLWIEHLAKLSLVANSSRRVLLSNKLVVAAPIDSSLVAFELNDATDILGKLAPGERFAMGDPEHVPAGIYAAVALRELGLWDQLASKIARTDNTRAALALVERGEAPLGFIYATDAKISTRVKVLAQIPAHVHPSISYEAAMLEDAPPEAVRFLEHLYEPEAMDIFLQFGFERHEPS